MTSFTRFVVALFIVATAVGGQELVQPNKPYGLGDKAQVEWLANALATLRLQPLGNSVCSALERYMVAATVDYAPGPYYKFEVIDKLGIKEEETKRMLSLERHRYLVALTAEIRDVRQPRQRCEFGPPDGIDLSYAERLDYENEYDLVFEFRIVEEMSEKYSDIATEADLTQALARYVNREKLVQAFVRQPTCTNMSYRLKNVVIRDNVPTDLMPGITPSVKAKLLALDKVCGG